MYSKLESFQIEKSAYRKHTANDSFKLDSCNTITFKQIYYIDIISICSADTRLSDCPLWTEFIMVCYFYQYLLHMCINHKTKVPH